MLDLRLVIKENRLQKKKNLHKVQNQVNLDLHFLEGNNTKKHTVFKSLASLGLMSQKLYLI